MLKFTSSYRPLQSLVVPLVGLKLNLIGLQQHVGGGVETQPRFHSEHQLRFELNFIFVAPFVRIGHHRVNVSYDRLKIESN